MIIKLSNRGKILIDRKTAKLVKKSINFNSNNKIIFDLSEVKNLGPSFIDELFGKLKVKNINFEIINIPDNFTKDFINEIIENRVKLSKNKKIQFSLNHIREIKTIDNLSELKELNFI